MSEENKSTTIPLKVIIEFEDRIISVEGDEAAKFWNHINGLCTMASFRVGTQNPFEKEPIDWEVIKKEDAL